MQPLPLCQTTEPSVKLTLLGTGDVRQVPVYGCLCLACQAARQDSSRYRRPCSALLECDGQRWLIDSGLTDLAERFAPGELSGILQTHYHADHAQGLLHLRWGMGNKIPVYGPEDPDGLADLFKHPGLLDFQKPFTAFERRTLGRLTVTAIPLQHSRPTFGYLFETGHGNIAYLTDTDGLSAESIEQLRNHTINLLVTDCTYPDHAKDKRNHNDLSQAIKIAGQLQAKQTVLTHIGHQLDTALLYNEQLLPKNITVGQDSVCYVL